MTRKLRQKKQSEEPIINLTPLIDVVFVILFTFIIVAPLLEIDKITLAGAGHGKERAGENSHVAIRVFADNTVSLNRLNVPLNTLGNELVELKRLYPEERAQLFHDKSAHFGTYQAIKNALEEAGFSEMDVILQP